MCTSYVQLVVLLSIVNNVELFTVDTSGDYTLMYPAHILGPVDYLCVHKLHREIYIMQIVVVLLMVTFREAGLYR